MVYNKLLIALSDIGTQQSKAMEATATAINWLVYFVVTYQNYGIIYRASNMRLSSHSDAAYLNVSKAHIRDAAPIFLSEE